MTSLPIRDQVNDHLLTPRNATLIIIDYQPTQIFSIGSVDRQVLVDNVVRVARIGKLYGLPIVLSTVNVSTGANKPTIPRLKSVLADSKELDRTIINAWEDEQFLQAVESTGRKKLVMCALWTEACLIFPSLDAMRDGYTVYPVADAVGGTSIEAHRTALATIAREGGMALSWNQLACELQRDWARKETARGFADILFGADSPIAKNEKEGQQMNLNL
jgi:nicotinamidase-related amidase